MNERARDFNVEAAQYTSDLAGQNYGTAVTLTITLIVGAWITSIIKTMQSNTKRSASIVGENVVQSNRTEEVFQTIMDMVSSSSLKVNEIAAACEEQAAQASNVMMSVETIASASEESAAASEETASTSQALAHLAEELNESVSVFQIPKSTGRDL